MNNDRKNFYRCACGGAHVMGKGCGSYVGSIRESENITLAGNVVKLQFRVVMPGGPIKRQWFDDSGNHHTLYENGAESILTKELLDDDRQSLEGP